MSSRTSTFPWSSRRCWSHPLRLLRLNYLTGRHLRTTLAYLHFQSRDRRKQNLEFLTVFGICRGSTSLQPPTLCIWHAQPFQRCTYWCFSPLRTHFPSYYRRHNDPYRLRQLKRQLCSESEMRTVSITCSPFVFSPQSWFLILNLF